LTDNFLEYAQVLRDCMTVDPQLPRPNPTSAFWQEPPHPTVSNAQSSILPQTTDFAVIGSGITGCSVTKALLDNPLLKGKRVTIFEARTLCSSATGRNGGHLVSDTPDSFGHLAATLGVDEVKKIARFSFASMDRVKKVVAGLSDELKEKAQLREVTSVSGFGDNETFSRFKASLAMFEEALPELRGRNEVVDKEEAKRVSILPGGTDKIRS
jgi:glycine/D-amino acid oxidase-like deaminating enzyme